MAGVMLSPGVALAWQIAGDLALSQQDEFIEPKHFTEESWRRTPC
jgi:hypothetical protein